MIYKAVNFPVPLVSGASAAHIRWPDVELLNILGVSITAVYGLKTKILCALFIPLLKPSFHYL